MTVIEGHLNGNDEKQDRNGETDNEKSAAVLHETNSNPGLHRVESQKQDKREEDDKEKCAACPSVETKRPKERISSRRMWRKTMKDAEKSVSGEGSSGIVCNSRDYLYIASTLVLGLALTLVLVYFSVLKEGSWKPARVPLQNNTEHSIRPETTLSEKPSEVLGDGSATWTTDPTTEQDISTDAPRVGLFDMLDLIPAQPDSLPQSVPSNASGNESFSQTPLSTSEATTMAGLVTGTDAPRVGLFDMLDLIPAQPDSLPQSVPSNASGNESFSQTPLSTSETTPMAGLVTGTDAPRVGLFDMLDLIPAQPDSLPQSVPSNDSGNVSFSQSPLSATEMTTMADLVTDSDSPKKVGLFQILLPVPANSSQPDDSDS